MLKVLYNTKNKYLNINKNWIKQLKPKIFFLQVWGKNMGAHYPWQHTVLLFLPLAFTECLCKSESIQSLCLLSLLILIVNAYGGESAALLFGLGNVRVRSEATSSRSQSQRGASGRLGPGLSHANPRPAVALPHFPSPSRRDGASRLAGWLETSAQASKS